jgi:hypothetical protein
MDTDETKKKLKAFIDEIIKTISRLYIIWPPI